jgi:transposase
VPLEVRTPKRLLPFGAHAEDVQWRNSLDILSSRCCGLDGHAKPVVAGLCVEGEQQLRTFSTMTADRWPWADWLLAADGTPIARESPGVDWRPVFNLREDHCTVLVVNAHHITAVPGRKTDVRDGDWIGDRRRHGLLKGSGIPPRHLRAWRELTRHRPLLVRARAAVAHRIQKLLESAHMKRGHVAPNGLGLSGRFMLQALADGAAEAAPLAPLAKGKRQAKAGQLQPSLTGHVSRTQRGLRHE